MASVAGTEEKVSNSPRAPLHDVETEALHNTPAISVTSLIHLKAAF